MMDIVFPKGNESEFIEIGKKLGYRKLCFMYDTIPSEMLAGPDNKNITVLYGNTGFGKKKNSSLVCCPPRLFDEKRIREVDVVYGLEFHSEKDFQRQSDSGFNQVLAKEFVLRKVAYGFDVGAYLSLPLKERAKILARFMQNIALCERYHVKSVIASFASDPYLMRNPKDLISFFITLGMSAKKAKESVQVL